MASKTNNEDKFVVTAIVSSVITQDGMNEITTKLSKVGKVERVYIERISEADDLGQKIAEAVKKVDNVEENV